MSCSVFWYDEYGGEHGFGFERGSSGGQIFAGDYKYVEGYGSYGYGTFVDMGSVCASLKTGASVCISPASSWGAYYC